MFFLLYETTDIISILKIIEKLFSRDPISGKIITSKYFWLYSKKIVNFFDQNIAFSIRKSLILFLATL